MCCVDDHHPKIFQHIVLVGIFDLVGFVDSRKSPSSETHNRRAFHCILKQAQFIGRYLGVQRGSKRKVSDEAQSRSLHLPPLCSGAQWLIESHQSRSTSNIDARPINLVQCPISYQFHCLESHDQKTDSSPLRAL
jgi:hypothetical protein